MSAPPDSSSPMVGRYRLLGKLAAGGMAEVFLAEVAGPAGFQKTVVLKRIHEHLSKDPAFVEMFLHEARLAAMLAHPNIVQILELGEADGAYFIAMEHVDGADLCSLAERVREEGAQLPWPLVARMIALACEGLAFAHDFEKDGVPLGLVHRDISPDNIMVSRAGAVKVMDFGVAKAATQRHRTQSGTIKGKLAYMSPEQLARQELDRRADVFALGITLYELLAGESPFDCKSEVSVIQSILHDTPVALAERRPDCPRGLADVVDRALQKDRELRYPDCRAMQRDLEAVLRDAPPVGAFELGQFVAQHAPPAKAPAAATAPMRAPASPKPRRVALVAGAVGVSIGLLAAGALVARSGAAPAAEPPGLARLVAPATGAGAPAAGAQPDGPETGPAPPSSKEPRPKPEAVALPKAPKPAASRSAVPAGMVEIPVATEDDGQAGGDSPRAQRLLERFSEADRDRDGRLSRAEFEELGLFKKRFSRFDADADGFVTLEEAKKELSHLVGRAKR